MVGRGALRMWGASLSLFVLGGVGVWGVERVERVEILTPSLTKGFD